MVVADKLLISNGDYGGGGIVNRNDCLADIISNHADKKGCPSPNTQTGSLGLIKPNPAPKTMCAAFKRPENPFLATDTSSDPLPGWPCGFAFNDRSRVLRLRRLSRPYPSDNAVKQSPGLTHFH